MFRHLALRRSAARPPGQVPAGILRRTDPDRASDICGAIDPPHRPAAAGAPHRPGQSARRVSRQGRGLDRSDAARRLGEPRPRRRRIRASRRACGTTTRSIPNAGRIVTDDGRSSSTCRDDGKPALCFAAHLGNWELPAVMAAAHGLPSAVLYRMPNNKAVATRDRPHPRTADGPPDPQPRTGAAGNGRGARARRASRHAGRSAFLARRRRHVLRPPLQGQPDDRAPRPPVRLPGGRRARHPPARSPLPHRRRGTVRPAARRRRAASMCRNRRS